MRNGLWILSSLVAAITASGAALKEDFANEPSAQGWKIFGDASLFRWNANQRHLEVTWDSGRPNSYFYRSLGTVLAKSDDFVLSFDLTLEEVNIGVRPGKPFTFQIAIGFLNLRSATQTNFARGTGTQSPSLVEFNYFPDSGFGATISPVIVSTNNQFIPSFSFPLELTVGDLFKVEMNYRGIDQTLRTTMTRNSESFGPVRDVKLPSQFTDFRVDTFAVSSFSDTGSDGSILARGRLDNVSVMVPAPPISGLVGGNAQSGWRGRVEFGTQTGWQYTLERTEDFLTWTTVGSVTAGTRDRRTLVDLTAPEDRAFYRIRAERP